MQADCVPAKVGGRESHGKMAWKKVLGGAVYIWSHGAGGMGCGKYVLQCIYLQNVSCFRSRYFVNGGSQFGGGRNYDNFCRRFYGLYGKA